MSRATLRYWTSVSKFGVCAAVLVVGGGNQTQETIGRVQQAATFPASWVPLR